MRNVGLRMCLFRGERSIITLCPPEDFGTRNRRLAKQGWSGTLRMIPFWSMSLMWGVKSPLQVEWEGRESFGGFTDHLHVRPFLIMRWVIRESKDQRWEAWRSRRGRCKSLFLGAAWWALLLWAEVLLATFSLVSETFVLAAWCFTLAGGDVDWSRASLVLRTLAFVAVKGGSSRTFSVIGVSVLSGVAWGAKGRLLYYHCLRSMLEAIFCFGYGCLVKETCRE